jgi:uncharacterized protein (TIGR02266 family)
MAQERKDTRTPITLKIKFKSASLDQFIERYSVDISRGGIFIRTKEPLSVGTPLRFEFQLQNASPLITGEGTVVWTRDPDPTRTSVAPGMGVRFDKLTPQSQQVLDRILTEKASRGETQGESRYEAGIQTQPPKDFNDHDAKTPLPQPVPGFGDDSDMTRVMQTDEARVLASRTRDREVESGSFDRDESTVQIDARTVQTLLAGTIGKSPDEAGAEPEAAEEPPPPPRPRRQTGSQPSIPVRQTGSQPVIPVAPAATTRKTYPPDASPPPGMASATPTPATTRNPPATVMGIPAVPVVPPSPPVSGTASGHAAQGNESATPPRPPVPTPARGMPSRTPDSAPSGAMHAPPAPPGLRTPDATRPASLTPPGVPVPATTSGAGGSMSGMAAGKDTDTAAVVRGGQLQGEAPATARPVESAPPMRRSVQLAAQRPTRSMVPILMVGISAVVAIVLYIVFSQSSDSGAGTTTPGPTAPAPTAGTPAAGGTTQNNPPTPNPTSPPSPPSPPAVATEPAAKNPSGTVDMTLVTTPPGATVAIDGIVQTGVTPLPLKGLPKNKSLQLVMTLAGYKPYTARVSAQAGNFPVTLEKGSSSSSTPRPDPNAPIMKVVEVNTIPVGADVFLEGKKVGKTPTRFKVPDLSRPLHLEVRRSGFHHQERTITSSDTFVPKGNDDVLELSYQLVSNLVPDKKPTGQTPPQENKPPEAPKPQGQPAATTPPPAEEKPKPKEAEKPAEAVKPETPPPPSPSAEGAAPATP